MGYIYSYWVCFSLGLNVFGCVWLVTLYVLLKLFVDFVFVDFCEGMLRHVGFTLW